MMFFMDVATNIADVILQLILFQHVTHLCKARKTATLIYFLVTVCSLTVLNWFNVPGLLCSLASQPVDILYCFILTGLLAQSVFLPTVFSLLISLSEGIIITLIQWIFPAGTVAVIMETDAMLIGCMIFSRIILAVMILLICRFVPMDFHLSKKSWTTLCAVSLYLFVLNMLVQNNLLRTLDFSYLLPLLLVGIALISAAFFQLGKALSRGNIEKSRLENELQQNQLKLRQQDEMVSIYQNLQGLQHDYRNHLQILSSLAEKNSQQELLTYIDSLSDYILPASTVVSTGNAYIDAIVNAKCMMAQKNRVGLRMEMQMPDMLAIPPSDICMLLSNILDNGLEACMNNELPEHRILHFYVAQQKGFLLISSHNNTEQLTETRRHPTLHSNRTGGFGLQQIQHLTKQYHGFCSYGTSEHTFHIQILLPHAVKYDQIFISQCYPEADLPKVCRI